ncbi:hypothetical protein BZA05DRAFT_340339 [Tricharina praecox]|uniref:uncharacterized protein n=1 Tax=Tricharina praecox TaxID=43433 RepID=UPI002221151F|nr:uncharacterized protein BZA05DRAFT_340339 [Tricharina praecox]KAI5848347.1 hypothetical protein BZA05DRAFT_340339 [Tricharina praecox]
MAFNFNWSPLSTSSTSSSAFYDHAKSLLTAALNKSEKPPIIVDDILVDDLNLGGAAPDLEILEIGDIAEDRFRGIFRMSYDGDACLTLRTKVQANPLNTYLSTTPSFTSPDPVAASSPLTIPVQITLSHFKLSGFVILVFSKAKGITLVFRNDPLESLKVSSTFDSIPFIADYLQKEIERQVRRIFQEDLPVAVHRLSLKLWNPEYAASLDDEATAPSKPLRHTSSSDGDEEDEDQFVNPLLTPAENSDVPPTMFSQKNLLKLASLVDSQKTLSLETPSISDVVFRAWASGTNHNVTIWDRPGALDAPTTPAINTTRTYDFSETGEAVETQSTISNGSSLRPSLVSSHSGRHVAPAGAPGRRRKKHRVVDLRKKKEKGDQTETPETSTETTPETSAASSEYSIDYDSDSKPTLPLRPLLRPGTPTVPITLQRPASPTDSIATADITYPPPPREKETLRAREASWRDRQAPPKFRMPAGTQGTILEQAILSKIMAEIQRSLEEERIKRGHTTKWGVERELESLCAEELPAYRPQ